MKPKEHLIVLKMRDTQRKNPNFPPHAIPRPTYTDRTANGLTKMVIDFVNLMGGQAERISNTGRAMVTKGPKDQLFNRRFDEIKWIPGQGTNGTADISATIRGKSVKIEVKIGKDRMSQAQKEYQQAIQRSGGVYLVAKTFDQIYNDLLPLFE